MTLDHAAPPLKKRHDEEILARGESQWSLRRPPVPHRNDG